MTTAGAPSMRNWRAQKSLFVVLLMTLAGNASATSEYSLRALGQLVPRKTSIAYDVNRSGVAVGTAINSKNSFTAVRFNLDGTVTDLGQLYPGQESAALSINDDGTIVGWGYTGYEIGQGEKIFAAVRFNESGIPTALGSLIPGKSSRAQAINNNGVIVGYAQDNNGVLRAVVFEPGGVVRALGYLGVTAEDSFAIEINDNDFIVGTSKQSGVDRAVVFPFDGSTPIRLVTQNLTSSAYGLSASGAIVGTVLTLPTDPTPNVEYGTAFDGTGGFTNLGQLDPGRTTVATSINSDGVIVGFGDNQYQRLAVSFDPAGGTITPLVDQIASGDAENWILEEAWAINELGEIVGSGKPDPGTQTAFLLTPIPAPRQAVGSLAAPEPHATLLALAAFMVTAALARHRITR